MTRTPAEAAAATAAASLPVAAAATPGDDETAVARDLLAVVVSSRLLAVTTPARPRAGRHSYVPDATGLLASHPHQRGVLLRDRANLGVDLRAGGPIATSSRGRGRRERCWQRATAAGVHGRRPGGRNVEQARKLIAVAPVDADRLEAGRHGRCVGRRSDSRAAGGVSSRNGRPRHRRRGGRWGRVVGPIRGEAYGPPGASHRAVRSPTDLAASRDLDVAWAGRTPVLQAVDGEIVVPDRLCLKRPAVADRPGTKHLDRALLVVAIAARAVGDAV